MKDEKKVPTAPTLSDQQVQDVGDALVKTLKAELERKEPTAAVMEVARKLLKDSGMALTPKAKGTLTPLTRGLPHRSDDVPPVSSAG